MKNVYERYGYYLKYIRALGSLPLSAKVTPKSLGIDDRTAQMAWRETKEAGLRMSFVPYIAYISSYYLFDCWALRFIQVMHDPVYKREAGKMFTALAREQRIDAANTLRSYPNLPILNLQPGWSDNLDRLSEWDNYDSVVMQLVTVVKTLVRHRELDEIRATERPEEYQAVNRDSEPSFLTTTTNPTTQTPNTQSSSEREAKRSGASSQKAPSGAASKTPVQKNKTPKRQRSSARVAVPPDPVQLTKPSSGETKKHAPKEH